jgi:hypothetical protein
VLDGKAIDGFVYAAMYRQIRLGVPLQIEPIEQFLQARLAIWRRGFDIDQLRLGTRKAVPV